MEKANERTDLEVLWSPKQVAEYFSLSAHTVYQWISKGKVLDPNKIFRIGNRVRIPRSEVERIAGKIRNQLKKQ